MANNYLVTGPPRSGKTTAIRRTVDRLTAAGVTAGGIVCPELREDGERVGFEVRNLRSGESATMAHVDRETGPSVGKYRVDVDAVDRVARTALETARQCDYVVVDEIAPMELYSDTFVEGVRDRLDADQPVLAAVHARSEAGLIGDAKARDDANLFEVAPDTRDALPATLAERVRGAVDSARG